MMSAIWLRRFSAATHSLPFINAIVVFDNGAFHRRTLREFSYIFFQTLLNPVLLFAHLLNFISFAGFCLFSLPFAIETERETLKYSLITLSILTLVALTPMMPITLISIFGFLTFNAITTILTPLITGRISPFVDQMFAFGPGLFEENEVRSVHGEIHSFLFKFADIPFQTIHILFKNLASFFKDSSVSLTFGYCVEKLPLLSSLYEITYENHQAHFRWREHPIHSLLHDFINPLRILESLNNTICRLSWAYLDLSETLIKNAFPDNAPLSQLLHGHVLSAILACLTLIIFPVFFITVTVNELIGRHSLPSYPAEIEQSNSLSSLLPFKNLRFWAKRSSSILNQRISSQDYRAYQNKNDDKVISNPSFLYGLLDLPYQLLQQLAQPWVSAKRRYINELKKNIVLEKVEPLCSMLENDFFQQISENLKNDAIQLLGKFPENDNAKKTLKTLLQKHTILFKKRTLTAHFIALFPSIENKNVFLNNQNTKDIIFNLTETEKESLLLSIAETNNLKEIDLLLNLKIRETTPFLSILENHDFFERVFSNGKIQIQTKNNLLKFRGLPKLNPKKPDILFNMHKQNSLLKLKNPSNTPFTTAIQARFWDAERKIFDSNNVDLTHVARGMDVSNHIKKISPLLLQKRELIEESFPLLKFDIFENIIESNYFGNFQNNAESFCEIIEKKCLAMILDHIISQSTDSIKNAEKDSDVLQQIINFIQKNRILLIQKDPQTMKQFRALLKKTNNSRSALVAWTFYDPDYFSTGYHPIPGHYTYCVCYNKNSEIRLYYAITYLVTQLIPDKKERTSAEETFLRYLQDQQLAYNDDWRKTEDHETSCAGGTIGRLRYIFRSLPPENEFAMPNLTLVAQQTVIAQLNQNLQIYLNTEGMNAQKAKNLIVALLYCSEDTIFDRLNGKEDFTTPGRDDTITDKRLLNIRKAFLEKYPITFQLKDEDNRNIDDNNRNLIEATMRYYAAVSGGRSNIQSLIAIYEKKFGKFIPESAIPDQSIDDEDADEALFYDAPASPAVVISNTGEEAAGLNVSAEDMSGNRELTVHPRSST